MNIHETHLAPRAKSLLLVAIATSAIVISVLGTAAERASAYWVCGPTSTVYRGPDFRCKSDAYRPLAFVKKNSSPRGYAVYRSSYPGGPSVSGSEFYSSTSDYYVQDFYCNWGYANAHNRHTVTVWVEYTLAASC